MRMKSIARALARRKRVIVLSTMSILVVGYAVTFAVVSLASSPTDSALPLTGGAELAYERWEDSASPEGRVILIHGAPADAGSWAMLKRRLEKRRDGGEAWPASEWLVVDRPGYGNTTVPEDLTLEGHASALTPALEVVTGEGAILVGHSYGGPVALRAAVEHPEWVGALVLIAGATDPYMQDSQWFRKAIDSLSFAVPEPWAVANRELLALTDENRDMESMLDRVTCPVVIVHGTWDPVCPYDGTVGYLQERLTNAASVEVVKLERVGHNIHLSHPEIVLDAIERARELSEEARR